MDLGTKFEIERIDRNGLWALCRMNLLSFEDAEREMERMLRNDPTQRLRIVRTSRELECSNVAE